MTKSRMTCLSGRASFGLVVFATTLLHSSTTLAEQWTLSQSIERGLEVSFSIDRAQGVFSRRQGQQETAGRWPNPSAELSYGDRLGQEQGTDRWRVQEYAITQPIPIGGRISDRHRAAGERVSAAGENIQLARLKVERQITSAFYQLQRAVDRVDLSLQQLDQSQRFQRVALKRARSGEASERDARRIDVLYGHAEQALAAARSEQNQAEGQLRNLLQLDAQTVLEVDGLTRPEHSASIEELRQRISEHPALMAANFRSRAALAQLDQARASRIPDLSVRIAREEELFDGRREPAYSVGLEMEIPLWNTGRGEVRSSKGEVYQADAEFEETRRQLLVAFKNNHAQLQQVLNRLDRLQTSVLGPAIQVLSLTEKGYQSGELEMADLIDATQARWDAGERRIDLLFEARLHELEVRQATNQRVIHARGES